MTEHELAVSALCESDPELKRTKFRKAVLDKWGHRDRDYRRLLKPGRWDMPKGKRFVRDELEPELAIVPDAWKIVGDDEIHCFEVSHTSILTARRRKRYGNLWFSLDCYELKLRLFACDTMAHPVECDLNAWWAKYAVPDMKRP